MYWIMIERASWDTLTDTIATRLVWHKTKSAATKSSLFYTSIFHERFAAIVVIVLPTTMSMSILKTIRVICNITKICECCK